MTGPGDPGALRYGERRHATVLFTDMEGFTAYTQGRDPEDIDGLMSSVFGRFAEIVDRYGGSVEKYIGDAMVAVFGVPRVHEDDAARAVGAAWELREVVAAEYPGLTFRTGIHSGLIATGLRGEHEVVTGHALAVASRLETAVEAGGILVSDAVYENARHSFAFGEPQEIRFRDDEQSVRARLVSGRRVRPSEAPEPFVGREALLQELIRIYLQNAAGTRASVMLVSQPGMGVSQVVDRFASELRTFPRFDASVVMARPAPFSRSPYSAMWNAIRELVGVDDSSKEAEIAEAVGRVPIGADARERMVSFLAGGAVEAQPGELYPLIAEFMNAVVYRDSTLFPALFVVDGIDEASPEEQDLLRFLVDRGGSRVFHVATTRMLRSETTAILPNPTILEVPPLDLQETSAMIAELRGGTPDKDFLADVHERTGGNPTFVRELLRYLEMSPDTSDIPAGIQTVVLASIQTLPDACQDLVRRLSVLDHPFRGEDAARMFGDECSTDMLDRLVEQRYLRREGSRYVFANGLVRRSVYDSLLNHNKRVLHAAAAGSVADDDLPPIVGIRHLVQAAMFKEAAVALSYLRGRITHFDRRMLDPIGAILDSAAVTDPDLVGELLYLRLAILFNTHAADADMETSLRDLLRLGVRTQRSDLLGRAYGFLLGRRLRNGALPAARHAGYQALRHYERSSPDARTDSVRTFLASVCIRLGRTDEADRLIAELENESLRLGGMAESAFRRHDYAVARELTVRSLEAAADDPPQRAAVETAMSLSRLVRILIECRSWEEILRLRPRLEDMAGPWYAYQTVAYSGLAMAAHHGGQPDEADAYVERAAYYRRQAKDHSYWYDAAVYLAMSRVEVGQMDAALAELEDLLIDLAGEPHEQATIKTLELMLRTLDGQDPTAAWFYLEELESMIHGTPDSRDYDRMLAAWYRHRLAVAGTDGSREALREAHAHAVDILSRQGDSHSQAGLRDGYPYRDILAEWERATGESADTR